MAAAGLWTSCSDLAKYVLEIQKSFQGKANHVLSAETTRLMLIPVKDDRGLGLKIGGSGPEKYFAFGGATMGYRAFPVGYESRGDGAVIMTKGDRGDQLGDEILRSIAAMYQWPDFHPIERSAVALSLSSELPFVGTFTGTDSWTFEIRKLDDHLIIITDGETDRLIPSSTLQPVPSSYLNRILEIEFISENDRDHGRLVDRDFHEGFQPG
jgi:hypothetical protein